MIVTVLVVWRTGNIIALYPSDANEALVFSMVAYRRNCMKMKKKKKNKTLA